MSNSLTYQTLDKIQILVLPQHCDVVHARTKGVIDIWVHSFKSSLQQPQVRNEFQYSFLNAVCSRKQEAPHQNRQMFESTCKHKANKALSDVNLS